MCYLILVYTCIYVYIREYMRIYKISNVGYVGSDTTRGADARLLEWSEREGLACAAPMHATWQSDNGSRYAVLDCFFWRAKTEQLSIAYAESFRSPDPRLDGVVVSVSGESIGKMPPLETLRSPIRLKMDRWSEKRTEWQDAVNKSLSCHSHFWQQNRTAFRNSSGSSK